MTKLLWLFYGFFLCWCVDRSCVENVYELCLYTHKVAGERKSLHLLNKFKFKMCFACFIIYIIYLYASIQTKIKTEERALDQREQLIK